MSLFSIPIFGASAGAVVAAVLGYLYRRKYAKSLARELGLENFTTYVVRGLRYRLARNLQPRAAARLSLRDFATNRLGASESLVHVPAAVPVKLPLDRMFVPLTALSTEQIRVSASEVAFGKHHRVLLVGDPGSGKSTLVKRIYRDICRDAITNGYGGRIPVLVELKNLDPDSEGDTSLADLVRGEVTSVNTYSGDRLYDSFLAGGLVTVLFDGLDEVRTSDFDAVSEKIIELCDHLQKMHPENRLVVTTRRQLYVNLPEEFSSKFDAHLTLEPFTPDDMYEFLRKWPYKQEPERQLARIFGNLATQPNIRGMCQTPLILAMYVATDQITGGEGLPETRPDFYRAVTDELLVRRRGRQHGLTTGLNVLRRNRQAVVERLALEHLLDGTQARNALQWDAAVKIVEEEEGLSGDAAERRIRELSRDTGLFTEERPEESLRFIHLTFCEFLAAQAVIHGANQAWKTMTERVEHGSDRQRWVERLSEVIVFAVALEKTEITRRDRMRWVARSHSTDLALRTMLDTQPYDDEVVLHQLDSIASAIANTPPQSRTEGWLHHFRLVAMTLRDRELVEESVTGDKSSRLAPFFTKTMGRSTSGLSQLFLSYLRLDPAGALELARSTGMETSAEYAQLLIRALDEPTVLAHALARLTEADEDPGIWASILALGALHHRSVSQRLAAMKTTGDRKIERLLDQGYRRSDWRRCWVTRGTVLGTVLEAGCRWPESSPVLALLATLPTRASKLTEWVAKVSIFGYIFLIPYLSLSGILIARSPREVILTIAPASLLIVVTFALLERTTRLPEISRLSRFATWRLLRSPPAADESDPNFRHFRPELLANIVQECPTASTLELERRVRYGIRHKGLPQTERWFTLVKPPKKFPGLLVWSPNLRLRIVADAKDYLLSKET